MEYNFSCERIYFSKEENVAGGHYYNELLWLFVKYILVKNKLCIYIVIKYIINFT